MRSWVDRHTLLRYDTGRDPASVDRSLGKIVFSPQGGMLACALPQGVLLMRDWTPTAAGDALADPTAAQVYSGHRGPVTDVRFHPQCDAAGEVVLLSSSLDKTAVIGAI
jgi:hypothetical protein